MNDKLKAAIWREDGAVGGQYSDLHNLMDVQLMGLRQRLAKLNIPKALIGYSLSFQVPELSENEVAVYTSTDHIDMGEDHRFIYYMADMITDLLPKDAPCLQKAILKEVAKNLCLATKKDSKKTTNTNL